ncbi:hypothetical protein LEP1GSC061_2243 [Leptospira wolffii serovar Khorat str. Khorat-H2]|nr:hypothetical protein LEP1GSC061_2243 [Leptospira wolffii serovar Khorat str. Khorat-H2]
MLTLYSESFPFFRSVEEAPIDSMTGSGSRHWWKKERIPKMSQIE